MQNETLEGFRLSPQQKHLWLLQQDSLAYRTQCVIHIEGKLEAEVLKETLQIVVDRHEILRTTFQRRPGIKIPIQVIADSSTPSWHTINLIDFNPQKQSDKIERLFHQERCFFFNFEQDSLLRSTLVNLSNYQHILIVTLPSLCADSWSLKNLVQEISRTYAACLKGEKLSDEPIQYIQFSEWQNELLEGEEAETGRAYWHQQKLWTLPRLTLPFEGKLDKSTRFESDVHAVKIEPDVVVKLEAIATFHNTKIAQVLLVCWQTLLWRLTGHSKIVVNTVFSGRKYEELHESLGLFAKWLPVGCPFQEDFKFTEILSQISETLHNNHKWQDYFFWEESTKSATETTGFPISFEFEEQPDKYDAGEVSFSIEKQYVCFERFKVKLTCVRTGESFTVEFHYDTELINKESIQCLAEQFETLVESAANNPEATVSELEILKRSERERLLVEFNNTQTNYPLNQCIHHLFETQVEKTPNNVAVVFEDQQLTYRQLNERANKIAHYLQELGVGPEVLVGICLERSLEIVISLLGILKAGGAYLPIDPALPPEGLTFRLQDAQAPILLTQQYLVERLPDMVTRLVCLDTNSDIIAQKSAANPSNTLTPENLAYVLYTSGSTGFPKGVAIEHRQILNYLHAILDRLKLPAPASFATVSTFAADLGNTAIFPALCTGGCLHVISQQRASDPEALGKYFHRYPIDCLKIVPSHLAALLASSSGESVLPRQYLILGGEALSWDLVEQIQQQAQECQILNHYGPTETTVGVTTFAVTGKQASYGEKTVPIGCPLANTQTYVLDKQLRLVPIGVPGELYISGAGLARGYLNRPELTAERFIINPFTKSDEFSVLLAKRDEVRSQLKLLLTQNSKLKTQNFLYKTGDLVRYLPDGNLEFLGRVDQQVKIRGFRLELGEIESVLSQHPGVRQAVVSVWEEESSNKRLAAYFVPNQQQKPSVSVLRNFLKEKLPEYMIPSAFVMLKDLPLTPNGKIERLRLPAPDQVRPELEETFVAPRTEVERTIATIWEEMLHVDKVGINDNFFELGGHSLLIVQIHSKLQEVLNQDILISDLFKYPTIDYLANYLSQGSSEESSFEEVYSQTEKRLASRKKRAKSRQNS